MRATFALLLLASVAGACATQKAPPPGDPLRPPARALPAAAAADTTVPVTKPLAQAAAPDDCDAVAPNEGPPPKPYKERKIEEGATHAKEGLQVLFKSEDQSRDPAEIGVLIESAVDKFFTALAADPYNPRATYNLAAAYARIGRTQCSMNLLARLNAMRNFHSKKDAIGTHADRLFGRGKKWKDKPDPDFDQLRKLPKFKDVTKDL
jgi:hypothetical protein